MTDTAYSAITCVSNIYIRSMHFYRAGDIERGHSHAFAHVTMLAKGGVDVTVNGKTTRFAAPHAIFIQAGAIHELVATEDDTVAYCIHALRDGDGVGDIIDPASIPAGVDPRSLAKPLTRPL